MNGQTKNFDQQGYCEDLENMSGPVLLSDLPQVRIDLRGVRDYAKKKGVPIASLTDEEKWLFMQKIEA